MTEEPQQSNSSLGVSQNFAGALAYVLGWVSGFVILIVEKDSAYVRFHAVQSIVVFVPLSVIGIVAGFTLVIPVIGTLIVTLMPIATLALWVILMVTALQGKKIKLPYISEFAENQLR